MSNPDPGLSEHAHGKGSRLGHLHVDQGLQTPAARADQLLAELPEVHGQLPEGDVGPAATVENDWAYHYLPKLDVANYDILRMFEMMNKGEGEPVFLPGLQPAVVLPNRAKVTSALSKLKLLVVMDQLKPRPRISGKPRRTQ